MAKSVFQAVECSPSKNEALRLDPGTINNNKMIKK
jgi:hypothetical protein